MKKLLVFLAATLFLSPATYALQSTADVAARVGNNSAPVEVRKGANESATNATLRAQDGDVLKLRKRPGRTMPQDDNTKGSNRATKTGPGDDVCDDRDQDCVGAARIDGHGGNKKDKKRGLDVDSDNDGLTDAAADGTRATDYNSSRSNRTLKGSSLDEDSDNDGLTDAATDGTRATDYNSSRSNKSYGAASLDEDNDGDGLVDTGKIRSNEAPPF